MALVVHPPKQEGGGGGGGGVTHHELLSGLLGGDAGGHYHLTREQWEKVLELIAGPPPEWDAYDGGYAGTTAGEYEANRDKWLDGGYSPNDHAGGVDGGGAA